MKKTKVNIMIQATMTEVDGVRYYELGTINKSKKNKSYMQLISAKTEEPINIMIQEISEKAKEAKHYNEYQVRKLVFIDNPKQAKKAAQVQKDERNQ